MNLLCNDEYKLAFSCLSITLLNQICAGQTAVLRGLHKLKFMAKSSLWGSLTGLFISVLSITFFV